MPGSTEGPQGHPQTRSISVCMHGLTRCARRSWCSVRSATPGPCRRCRQCTCADTGIHTGPQPASTSPWANISAQLPRSPNTTRTARYRGGHGSIRPNGHLRPTWPPRPAGLGSSWPDGRVPRPDPDTSPSPRPDFPRDGRGAAAASTQVGSERKAARAPTARPAAAPARTRVVAVGWSLRRSCL